MLIGESYHNLDAKGRMIVPVKMRGDLGDGFVVTRGLDGCLFGFPKEGWFALQARIKELPLANKNARDFQHYINARAAEITFDKQGRIVLPQKLREYAQIGDEVVLVGMGDRIEFWQPARWEALNDYQEQNEEQLCENFALLGI